jgi:hypothetical protein
MAEYKGIKGFKVQTVSTDPAASAIATGTWASGGPLNTAREGIGSQGTQTAALAGAGQNASKLANVEIYDGSSWTEVTDVNLARSFSSGFGTTTAGLIAGGLPGSFPPFSTANTETWNGSAWTEVNNLNTARGAAGSATSSPNTAGLIAGGGYVGAPAGNTNVVESWNGTSWTEVADLNTPRSFLTGLGIQTAALVTGSSAITGVTEQWDGSSWTEVADLNTGRRNLGASGLYTDGLVFGGDTDPGWSSLTEYWDGTSWTELNDLSTARRTDGCSTTPTAIAFGGNNGSFLSATEEWTVAPPASFSNVNLGQVFYNSTSDAFKVTQQSVPAGTWSSGGNLNETKYGVAGAGIQTAALAAGGNTADPGTAATANTESYNGTSWTEVNNLNTARYFLGGAGTQTAAIATAGSTPPNVAKSENESWNGTSWTEVNEVNTARWQFGQAGTATASLMASGTTDNNNTTNVTESWNGTSWSEITEVNVARFAAVMTGSQTEALYIAGEKGTPDSGGGAPYTKIGNTEYWNGSTWTELADLNSARTRIAGSGIYTSSLVWGGPPTPANTEAWNGTSWTEVNNLAVGGTFRTGAGGNASTPNATALAIGATPPISAATEEWNVPTVNSTLTAS